MLSSFPQIVAFWADESVVVIGDRHGRLWLQTSLRSVAPPSAGSTVSCDMVFRIGHVLLASDRVLKA
ncbi:MAG TPA: hypothetical protein DCE19_02135 [Gemmatimonadetes bacterium]|nr:hypothetical protein [Gemmatimonadota bacterium]